jgi:hypothetical protein
MARHQSYERKWFNKPRFLAIGIPLIFLVISGIAPLLVVQYQFRELKNQTLALDRIVTSLLSDLIVEHEKAAIGRKERCRRAKSGIGACIRGAGSGFVAPTWREIKGDLESFSTGWQDLPPFAFSPIRCYSSVV